MWMMGCNDGGGFNMSDSFNGRKLRPLIPRPSSSSTNTSTVTTPTPTTNSNTSTTTTTTSSGISNISTSNQSPCFRNLHHHHHHHTDLFLLNNHLAMVSEQSKRDLQMGSGAATTTTTTVVSSRWNPTPEQLRILEELYRRGTRTPTADQIQNITAQLRRYGKIEGKNVFYWFQNHKARERQKRRRRSESIEEEKQLQLFEIDNQRNDSGSSRTVYEVEQTKNWALPTNCSTTLTQEPVSMQEAAAVGAAESGMKTDGWIELEERELQHSSSRNTTPNNNNNNNNNNNIDIHATWQMMNLSCSSPHGPPPPLPPTNHHLINTTTTTTFRPSSTLLDHPKLNIFLSPNKERFYHYHQDKLDDDDQESPTLELFPIRKDENNDDTEKYGVEHHLTGKECHELLLPAVTNMNNGTPPCKFFEFL